MKKVFFTLLILSLLTACAPAPASLTPAPISPSLTPTTLPPTATLAPTALPPTIAPTSLPPTAIAAPTATAAPSATPAESVSEMLASRIVFYLIVPEKNRTDACGDIRLEPIISKRYRTGDKIQDVQIALNMLFSVGSQFYGAYYNALWNTQFDIQNVIYDREKDYMTIQFGGFFPAGQLSTCDKHGIRQQIWTTFYHYDFKEKTFMYYNKFLIDQLGRK